MIVKIKNKITLFTLLAKNPIHTPLKIWYTTFFKVSLIFYCTIVFFINNNFERVFTLYSSLFIIGYRFDAPRSRIRKARHFSTSKN